MDLELRLACGLGSSINSALQSAFHMKSFARGGPMSKCEFGTDLGCGLWVVGCGLWVVGHCGRAHCEHGFTRHKSKKQKASQSASQKHKTRFQNSLLLCSLLWTTFAPTSAQRDSRGPRHIHDHTRPWKKKAGVGMRDAEGPHSEQVS